MNHSHHEPAFEGIDDMSGPSGSTRGAARAFRHWYGWIRSRGSGVLWVGILLGCSRDHLVAVYDMPDGLGGASNGGNAGALNANGGTENRGGAPSSGGAIANAGGSDPGHPDGGACAQPGERCDAGTACCFGDSCMNGFCPARCSRFKESCSDSNPCCHGTCIGGFCECLPIGNICTRGDECCSGACASSGELDGNMRCQALEGCRPEGEIVFLGKAECCSNYVECSGPVCRCRRGPDQTCIPLGDLCDSAARPHCCSADGTPGSPNQPRTSDCYFKGATTIPRCYELRPQSEPCEPLGSACVIAGDCCPTNDPQFPFKYCLPTPGSQGAGLFCSDRCRQAGEPCRASRDCCVGTMCAPNGTCVSPSPCRQLAQPCSSPDECCSGFCVSLAPGLPWVCVP